MLSGPGGLRALVLEGSEQLGHCELLAHRVRLRQAGVEVAVHGGGLGSLDWQKNREPAWMARFRINA